MMGMMGDKKKVNVTAILGDHYEGEEKEEMKEEGGNEMVDALFEAISSGNKERFSTVFNQMVEASYYKMKNKEHS